MIEQLKKINFPVSPIFDNKKVAVAINLFNRLEGFEQYAEHLNRCDELENVPIIIFIDGGYKSKQKELIEKSKLIKHKYKYVIRRPENYGCERGFLNIFNTILCDLSFDYMFFIEDDIIVGKNCFKYLYTTFKQLKLNEPNLAIYQGYSFCIMDLEEKKKLLHEVEEAKVEHNIGMWGFIMDKSSWIEIRNVLSKYEAICNTLPTNGTSHMAMITTHRKQVIETFNEIVEKYNLQENQLVKEKFYKKENEHCTVSIDGAMALALIAANKKRYKPVVNRVLNVGDTGAHFTKEIFKNLKLDQMALDEVW